MAILKLMPLFAHRDREQTSTISMTTRAAPAIEISRLTESTMGSDHGSKLQAAQKFGLS